jgi:hypothetical protein
MSAQSTPAYLVHLQRSDAHEILFATKEGLPQNLFLAVSSYQLCEYCILTV